jgi:transglutaminase-like putative cysteine protease
MPPRELAGDSDLSVREIALSKFPRLLSNPHVLPLVAGVTIVSPMKSVLVNGIRLIVLLALAVAGNSLRAADTNRYSGDTWRLMELPPVLKAAAGVTLAKYPDCDSATVDCRSVRVYRPDGTGEAQDETFTKVLTEKGRRDSRTIGLSFMLPYNAVEVPKLEIIKPDGSVLPVDVAANSKESIDDSQMSANIYDPNIKVLRVNIPQLEIGDIIHSVIRFTTLRPVVAGEYAEVMLFEQPSLLLHQTYEVHAPAAKPLKWTKLRDEIKGTVRYAKTKSGDTLVHTWEVNNVPRMFDEPDMPSYERVLQRLYVSTLPDWPAVSKWYWDLSKPHLDATTPELKKKVAELTAGCTNDLAKVHALFYFVSKQVRYMGLTPEKDRPGFEPHDVCLTFDKRYGVCRDKAALLVAMLRVAGLNAYPVLINVGTRRDMEVPDPGFNHAIAAVELKKGEYILMDPTNENTRELLPDSDRDQSYLVCRPEGEKLLISPIRPAEENMMRVTTAGTLDAAGALTAETKLQFGGVNDNAYRNAFVKMKPDDRRRFFERALKAALPGARLDSLTLTPENLLDMSEPVGARLKFTVDGAIASGHGKAVVNLPWIGKNFGIINFILDGTGLEKRKYPLKTQVACGLEEKISLSLGSGFRDAVSLPSYEPVNDATLRYQQSVGLVKGHEAGTGPSAPAGLTLAASRQLQLKVVEFSPKEYLRLKKTLERLDYDQRKAPVLALNGPTKPAATVNTAKAAPPVDSNAQILESHKELTVQDAHTAVYRVRYAKRILTYAGKKRESEVKIEFNPSCQEAKFIKGVVVSKAGQRQEISPDEINVMDAGWNAAAKRYTGGKILVANLPGVEIGSTIEVEFEITTKGKPFLAGYEGFQLPDGMDKKDFVLTAPADVAVQSYVSGPTKLIQETASETNDQKVREWSAQNLSALPAEPQLPPEWTYAAGVGYFIGDAAAYWSELNKTMLDRAGQSAAAAAKAKALTAPAKTKLAAVTAIRDFIVKSIRVAGPTFTELPLTELSAADTTLADGYGHLADRAILFYAMLKAAGLEPEFVLASALPPIAGITNVTAQLPLPESFSAPLVRVSVDGREIYLNDTDEYAQPGTTAHEDRLAMIPATQKFDVVRVAPDCQNKFDTAYSLALANDGKARIAIRRQYSGLNYAAKKKFFAELPPEERNRYFQEAVSAVAQGAQPVGGLTTKFDTYPGVEEFTVELDQFAVVDGKNLYFDLPFTAGMFGPGPDQRALPLFVPGAADNTIRADIQLPPKFQHLVIAPEAARLPLPDGAGGAVVTSTNAPGRFDIRYELDTAPAIISADDYPAVLNVESALGRKSARVFLLEK